MVTGLPLLLDASSVEVLCETAPVGSVRVELDVDGMEQASITNSRDALLALEHAVRLTEQQLESIEQEVSAARTLGPATSRDDGAVPSPEQLDKWRAADGARAAWIAESLERVPELTATLKQQREAVDIARTQMAQDSDEADWRRWAPTRRLRVQVTGSDEVELVVRYRVPGALWSPAYALHVDSSFRTGRLVLRAVVAQASGEDWSSAQVSLSTAPLQRRVDAPVLKSRRLGRAGPPARSAWRPLPDDLEVLFPQDLNPDAMPRERAGGEREEALGAEWTYGSVAALDTQVPKPKRRGRLAPPTPPPAMQRAERSRPPMAPKKLMMSAPSPAPAAAEEDADVMAFGGETPSPAPQAPRAAAPPPSSRDIVPEALDYGALRMVGWDGAPGQRGRLTRSTVEAEALRHGAEPEAVGRLERARWTVARLANEVARLPLPPHHVHLPSDRGPDYRFDVVGRCDIPSDGRWHGVSLQAHALDLAVSYRAIPREDPRVFRTVTATMDEGLPLLPGPVDVYVAGRLEVTTPWKGSGQDAPITLGLGPEDGLRVARNVRYREESTGLFGGGRRIHTEVDVTVASSLAREVVVELLDRLPVADDDSVAVSLESGEPTASPWTGDEDGPVLKGGLKQSLRLAPGGEAKATLHWHMSVGSKYEVAGGERRGS